MILRQAQDNTLRNDEGFEPCLDTRNAPYSLSLAPLQPVMPTPSQKRGIAASESNACARMMSFFYCIVLGWVALKPRPMYLIFD